MGQKSKAKSYYKKASEVDTKLSFCRYWKGLALEKLGRKAEAKALYDALLAEGKNAIVEAMVQRVHQVLLWRASTRWPTA